MSKIITFERAMARLEEIVTQLDKSDTSLDQSLALFGEGADLLAFCDSKLESARLEIETLFPEEEES